MIFFKHKEHILYFYVIIRMIYITKEILKAFLSNKNLFDIDLSPYDILILTKA